MSNTVVTLPFPVSTNSLYRNLRGKGRVKTERHRTWRRAAGWDLEHQKPPSVEGPVALDIALGRPTNQDGTPSKVRRDLSNLIKCLEDLLVDHGVIEDDSLVQDLRVYWAEDIDGARVAISRRDAA